MCCMDVEGITSGRSNGKELCFYFVCLAEESGCGKKIRQFLPSANHDKICSYEHFNCENFTLQNLYKIVWIYPYNIQFQYWPTDA